MRVFSALVISAVTSLHLFVSGAPAAPVVGGPTAVGDVRVAQVADTEKKTTNDARKKVSKLVKQRKKALASKKELDGKYAEQLREIELLKQRKASWRRDNQLRDKKSSAASTATELTAIDKKIRALKKKVKKARKALVKTINAELAANPSNARREKLERWRSSTAKKLRKPGKKIVIPDDSIDPLADPEDLEQQAEELRQSEEQLEKEIANLAKQASRFEKMEELRRKRARAAELDSTDDDNPRRTTGRVSNGRDGVGGGGAGEGAGLSNDQDPSPAPNDADDGFSDPSMFNNDPTVVLADVVDDDTLDVLRKAERSDDLNVKAKAADQARDKVEERLQRLRERRKLIEKRAKNLRKKR
jgi:hypothetical protein